MVDACDVAKVATGDITCWLNSLPYIKDVVNVEDDTDYQKKDIDLLLHTTSDRIIPVEIKGDRYSETGNFFFETISNVGKDTLGCFLYTEAEFLFYYFVCTKELYTIPMKEVRQWFYENMDSFIISTTSTLVGGGFYTTRGRLVPRDLVVQTFPSVKYYCLT